MIAQVVYACMDGDRILASADSFDLKKYGLTVGLTNYAAAYCVGLLCARRLLKKVGLDKQFVGVEEVDGEYYDVNESAEDKKPFTAILDLGLARPSKGNRGFACMKGAVDGGMAIPHSAKCFPGGEDSPEENLSRIVGGHVSEYITELKDSDSAKFDAHFSRYVKAYGDCDDLENIYRKAHAAIRADPSPSAEIEASRKLDFKKNLKMKNKKPRLNASQKRERVQLKLKALMLEMSQK